MSSTRQSNVNRTWNVTRKTVQMERRNETDSGRRHTARNDDQIRFGHGQRGKSEEPARHLDEGALFTGCIEVARVDRCAENLGGARDSAEVGHDAKDEVWLELGVFLHHLSITVAISIQPDSVWPVQKFLPLPHAARAQTAPLPPPGEAE